MTSIDEMRKNRFQFLRELYDLSGAEEAQAFDYYAVGRRLGFDHRLINRIWEYLVAEGLIREAGLGGQISITHRGIVEIETALSEPEVATEYFPAVVNIISARQITDSQIQQAGSAAVQVLIREDRYEQLHEAVNALKESIAQLSLAQQDITDLKTDIQTIEAQMSKSTPSRTIITECVLSIIRILEQAAGTVLGGFLLAQFNALLGG